MDNLPTNAQEMQVRSYVTTRELVGMCTVFVLLVIALYVTSNALDNITPTSAKWFWLDVPPLCTCVVLSIFFWTMQRRANERFQAILQNQRKLHVLQGPHQGTWTVIRSPRSAGAPEVMVAILLVFLLGLAFFAVGIIGLLHAHNAQRIAEHVQYCLMAWFPGAALWFQWPYVSRRFDYVVDLRRGAERMSVLFQEKPDTRNQHQRCNDNKHRF
ncbi:hypothetical protein Alches_26820 [Alicyclobacillus hesperidum subsp. aegles]|nr:hypothetical protein Alches_26820 [Alicyclobacillus hesperidum subsp. aegles]